MTGKINMTRVILGGLAAGVVINVIEGLLNGVLLADQFAAVMQSLNRSATSSMNQIVAFNLIGFAIGILTVRLYAAIRPRYGAGPNTAMRAGLMIWGVGNLLPNLGLTVMGIVPVGLMSIVMVIGLVELVLAAELGAYLYKEEAAEESPRTMTARA